jgi:uncharacterized protein
MRFAITGATGLVGTELRRQLADAGHDVTTVVRSHDSIGHSPRAVLWHPARGTIDRQGLEEHDVVVHLAGESIAGVWTSAKKRRIRRSRVRATMLLAKTLAELDHKPRVLVSASGFNYYGDRPTGEVDESAPRGDGFLADLAERWEACTRPAQDAGIRVVHMRLGTVLSPRGGMLASLLPLFRLGLGARLGSGRQYWPWIALPDVPGAILHLLQRPEIEGPVNFVAPQQVTNAEFTDSLADVLRRPALLRVPSFAARLAPGGMGSELLLSGARVIPRKLLDSGYDFRYPELKPALRALLA